MNISGKQVDYGTLIVAIIAIIIASQSVIMGYIPAEYAGVASIVFVLLSQYGSNYAKNQIQNAQPELEQEADPKDTA